MLRTIAILLLLLIAVLFLPLPFQLVLLCIAVVVVPHRLTLFIPAVFSDALYAPSGHIVFSQVLMTLFVAVLLVVHWLLVTQTRVAQAFYGVETR